MIRLAKTALGLILALAAAVPVRAEGNVRQPFELIRALRVLQDEIASGNAEAHRSQQELMADLPAQLLAVPPERWNEARNVRAAIAYVLSGGDPRVLRKLLRRGDLRGPAADLAQGAVAFAEGRDDEARALLLNVDARRLDVGLGGAVALVQSALVSESDPQRASSFLDQARLLGPGTLVEEAALRRQILLLPSAGQLDRLDLLLTRYVRRFRRSNYARTFWRQLATEIAGLEQSRQSKLLARFERPTSALESDERRELYLAMAREGLARGRIDLVRFATGQALQRTAPGVAEVRRAQVYEAAALVSTEDYEQAVKRLTAIGREQLAREEAELVDAALSIAIQIRRSPPESAIRSAEAEAQFDSDERLRELTGIGLSAIRRARTLVASVDALLGGEAE